MSFQSLSKIGLKNIGGIACLNAILQCFCHIEKFVNFFKYNPQIIQIVKNDKNKLSSSFKLLIEKLWPNKNDYILGNKYYSPEEIKNKIIKMNPSFAQKGTINPEKLINFIIMTLHEELNKAQNISEDNNNIIIDKRNKEMAFQNFANNFTEKYRSIISDLFYSVKCNLMQCFCCFSYSYNYQSYSSLSFNLEDIYNFKKLNIQLNMMLINPLLINNYFMNNNQYIPNQISILDCLEYYRKMNNTSGSCSYCYQNINIIHSMQTNLTLGPEILILIFNKGMNIEIKLNFNEIINLENYIEYKKTGFIN